MKLKTYTQLDYKLRMFYQKYIETFNIQIKLRMNLLKICS